MLHTFKPTCYKLSMKLLIMSCSNDCGGSLTESLDADVKWVQRSPLENSFRNGGQQEIFVTLMEGWWRTGKIGHTGFTRRVQLCPKVRCEFGSSSTYDLHMVLGRLRSHKQNPVRRLLCEAQSILYVVVPGLLYCVRLKICISLQKLTKEGECWVKDLRRWWLSWWVMTTQRAATVLWIVAMESCNQNRTERGE